jgi:regulator of sirC expression with transglutaminase-like and TPR domain
MPREHSRLLSRAAFMGLVDTHGNDIPLGEAAAWMDAEERRVDTIDETMRALDALADGLYIPEEATIYEAVARLNHHLFVEHGFEGASEDYDAPGNSFISEVIARKRGLPILLSLIYMEVGRRVGMSIHGISFPTHFVVSPAAADPRFFVDPFNKGEVIRPSQLRRWFDRIVERHNSPVTPFEHWVHPVNHRIMLVRMNNNLKAACMGQGDLEGALRAVERLLILMPDALDVRRDRGLLRLELGNEEEGAKDVDAYLAAYGKAELTAQD